MQACQPAGTGAHHPAAATRSGSSADAEIKTGKQALATWQRSSPKDKTPALRWKRKRNEVVDVSRSRAQTAPEWKQSADEVGATLRSALEDVRARRAATARSAAGFPHGS